MFMNLRKRNPSAAPFLPLLAAVASLASFATVTACVGPPGADGVDGVNGVDGQNGADGQDGADGADGADGEDGADGDDGNDGEGCTVVDNGDNTATLTCPDGTSVIIPSISPPPVEECDVVGDEDDNGLADCEDPACAEEDACVDLLNGFCNDLTVLGVNDSVAVNFDDADNFFVGSCSLSGIPDQAFTFTSDADGIISITATAEDDTADLSISLREECLASVDIDACINNDGSANLLFAVAKDIPNVLIVEGSFSGDNTNVNVSTVFTPLTEVEPNDDIATANILVDPWVGLLVGDNADFVSVVIPPFSDLTVFSHDFNDSEVCNIDTVIDVFDGDGTTLATNDDDPNGLVLCSRVTVSNDSADTQTVFVKVRNFNVNNLSAYGLTSFVESVLPPILE